MTGRNTPPKYNVAIVEAVILIAEPTAARFTPLHFSPDGPARTLAKQLVGRDFHRHPSLGLPADDR